MGRDEDVGRADFGLGHHRPGREDDAPRDEEFPGVEAGGPCNIYIMLMSNVNITALFEHFP